MRWIEDKAFYLFIGALMWFVVSVFSAGIKRLEGMCGKRLHVDRILWADLFCEVGE